MPAPNEIRQTKRHNKKEYPIGTRIELELMSDFPTTMPKGLRGTVSGYTGESLLMDWDNHSFFLLYWSVCILQRLRDMGLLTQAEYEKIRSISEGYYGTNLIVL